MALAGEIASTPPRPVLHFLIDKLQRPATGPGWRWRWQPRAQPTELARVEFDYAGHRIRAETETREVLARDPAGLVRLARDVRAEQVALDRLARTGSMRARGC